MGKNIKFRPIDDDCIDGFGYGLEKYAEIIDTGKLEYYYLVVTEDGGLTWVFKSVTGEYLESDPAFDKE